MRRPTLNLQTIAVATIVVIGVGAFVRLLKGSDALTPNTDSRRPFNIVLLTDEEGSKGKVVRAMRDGKVLGSYTCSAQDAEVAWLYYNGPQTAHVPESMPLATGEDQGSWLYDWYSNGPLMRVVFHKQYVVKPRSVSLLFPAYVDRRGETLSTATIRLTHFAEVIRYLAPPSADEARLAETDVRAEYEDTPGYSHLNLISVRPTLKEMEKAHEMMDFKIIESTYQPEGTNEINVFDGKTDAVKVRIDRYRYVDSIVYLHYTNAQIATIDGANVLRLPTTQVIGNLLDATATVIKHIPDRSRGPSHGRSVGEMVVTLDRKQHPEVNFSPLARLESLSPSLESMGLDLLRVRLGQTYDKVLERRGPRSESTTGTIPEIRIGVRISTPVKYATKTYVLPIHHVKRDKPQGQIDYGNFYGDLAYGNEHGWLLIEPTIKLYLPGATTTIVPRFSSLGSSGSPGSTR